MHSLLGTNNHIFTSTVIKNNYLTFNKQLIVLAIIKHLLMKQVETVD